MAINISKVSEAFYTAVATPPHVDKSWSTVEPLRMHRLCEELIARGALQLEVGDAINDADREFFTTGLKERVNG